MDLGTALHLLDLERESANGIRQLGQTADPTADAHRMLCAVASEIASLAGSIAAAASIVNTLPGSTPTSMAALTTNLPPEAIVYRAVLPRLAAANLPVDVFAEIQHFHVRLDYARNAAIAYGNANADAGSTVRGGAVHVDVLVSAWRDLCAASIALIELLARHCRQEGETRWTTGLLDRGKDMLALAASGASPCVMSDGSVEVPGIAERRQHARYPVSWPAGMLAGGQMLPVRIDDVSLGGLGISGSTAAVTLGDNVIVELLGRLLSGRISWAVGRRFGVELAVPLKQNDSIIETARGLK